MPLTMNYKRMAKMAKELGWGTSKRKKKKNHEEIKKKKIIRNQGFFASERWLLLRQKVLCKYGHVCMKCGASGKSSNPIQIDHVYPRSRFPKLQWDIDNLQVLCKRCNHEKGTEIIDYRRRQP